VWFGLTVVIWLGAELVLQPGWLRRWRGHIVDLGLPVVLVVLLAVVLVVPTVGRVFYYAHGLGTSPSGTGAIPSSDLGNLAHPLSAYEALGIWDWFDFRYFPSNVFHTGELSALALGVLLLGVAWSLTRREFILPAALAACAIVYWHSRAGQSPYVTAKALVIAGPVIAINDMRGLLSTPLRPLPRVWGLARALVAAAFVYFVAHSSYQELRNEPVWPQEPTAELLSLERMTRGDSLLFLGNSDFTGWLFSGSYMSALGSTDPSMGAAITRPNKPFVYGTALDFDSVDPTTINRFAWVITTTGDFASAAPAGFHLVRRLPLYELWKRVAPVQPRLVIEPSGAPGAVLDCRTPTGRALSRRHGVAAVMYPPVITPLSGLVAGTGEVATLHLLAGRWELSLQYTSAVPLDILVPGHRWRMPAYLDRPGPVFDVGPITSTGTPIPLGALARKPSPLTGVALAAVPTAIIATRLPDTRQLVPLGLACGRYIDWYRLSGS
jgi:hypothetical protein